MSPRIRKKDPCPCGSGKKYKNCCFKKRTFDEEFSQIGKKNKAKPTISRLALMRFNRDMAKDKDLVKELDKTFKNLRPGEDFNEWLQRQWDDQKLKNMGTEDILDKLQSLNIVFDEKKFKEEARDYISAIVLADELYYPEDWNEKNPDDDFVWIALIELWRRILPEHYNVEMLDNALYDGYQFIEDNNITDGLKEWENAWTVIKYIIPSHFRSVESADEFLPYPLVQPLVSWCQDFDEELYRKGVEDKSYFAKRIAYVSEFCQRFPDTGQLVIPLMLKAEAESYHQLGDMEKAEKKFEQLIRKFQGYAPGYISWGNMYWASDRENPDYGEAERIYRLGLSHCTEKSAIYERLRDLKKERDKS